LSEVIVAREIILALALHFLNLTGPNGQSIDVAVDQIVSLRARRKDEEHLHGEVNCLVHTTDGKFIAVRETCKEIEEKLTELYRRREEGE
jgi:hypothetical protein